jgi:hypothetical protein
MPPLLAGGPPGGAAYDSILAVAAFIFLFPAAMLVAMALLPPLPPAHAAPVHRVIFRWSCFALAAALLAVAFMATDLHWFDLAHRVDLPGKFLDLHPSLSLATACALAALGSFLHFRRSASPSFSRPAVSSLKAPTWRRQIVRTGSRTLLGALMLGTLLHPHPFAHVALFIWAVVMVLAASGLSMLEFMHVPTPAQAMAPAPATPAPISNPASRLAQVALPGLLAVLLGWLLCISLASWQDHRARTYCDRISTLLRQATNNGQQPYPAALPATPEFGAPWLLSTPVEYQARDHGRSYLLKFPLSSHPGAQMHYEPHPPGWFWHGYSKW